jgi:6,7-dimethyl-8-ribityllumazine synthase
MAEAGAFLEQFSDEEKAELSGQQFAVVVGRFYEDLAQRLLRGAREGFQRAGVAVESVHELSVPGAYELPFAAKTLIEGADKGAASGGKPIRGVACLGVVIRGETDHYDFVCGGSARGIQDVQLTTGVPCAFGVITCDTREQAEARADGSKRDQGRHAAEAVLRSALVLDRLKDG